MVAQDASGNSLLLIDDLNSTRRERERERKRKKEEERRARVREKEREFVHAAGVISRLVCTRVFEPRVLFPLTGEQSARRAARRSLLPPFKPLSRTEPPSCSLRTSPRNPRRLTAVSLLPLSSLCRATPLTVRPTLSLSLSLSLSAAS